MAVAKEGAQALGFSLPDLAGGRRTLEELLAGGPVALAFFKVSCPTCQYTFPFLERLHQRLAGAAAQVVGVSQDVPRKTETFNREYGVNFPVLLDAEDDHYAVSSAYCITHVPTVFLIEPEGRVALVTQGFVKADLEEIARRLGAANLFHRDERVESFRAG